MALCQILSCVLLARSTSIQKLQNCNKSASGEKKKERNLFFFTLRTFRILIIQTVSYKGTISLYSFLSPRTSTIISAPSTPVMVSPVRPFRFPLASSWHNVASWEDTIILPLGEVGLSPATLLCGSGVGAGALMPLLPAPTLAPALPPLLLGGGPQRKAWAGL